VEGQEGCWSEQGRMVDRGTLAIGLVGADGKRCCHRLGVPHCATKTKNSFAPLEIVAVHEVVVTVAPESVAEYTALKV
jgi:hypothetical protein